MWIQISSGRGPEECCLAVGLFLKDLLSKCRKKDIDASILEQVPGKHQGTYKSVLLTLDGPCAHKLARNYEGTILWICASPYRPGHKRKNWYISVEVYVSREIERGPMERIKIETMRGTGAGGQNINKVETAVRVTHLSTGFTVTAREERSQHRNKKLALARLARLLEQITDQKSKNMRRDMWTQHDYLTRGNPVRVYEGPYFQEKNF